MPEVHPTARVNVSVFIGDCFATEYLTENRRRVLMFRRNFINGSFEWMGVPDFLRVNVALGLTISCVPVRGG